MIPEVDVYIYRTYAPTYILHVYHAIRRISMPKIEFYKSVYDLK